MVSWPDVKVLLLCSVDAELGIDIPGILRKSLAIVKLDVGSAHLEDLDMGGPLLFSLLLGGLHLLVSDGRPPFDWIVWAETIVSSAFGRIRLALACQDSGFEVSERQELRAKDGSDAPPGSSQQSACTSQAIQIWIRRLIFKNRPNRLADPRRALTTVPG